MTPWLGRLGWVFVGALSLYALLPNREWSYPEVIVPAPRIIVREVPSGPPGIVERIRYVYLTPDVRAVAPGGAVGDVARFCRPTILAIADTLRDALRVPSPSVIRSGTLTQSIIPLRKAHLFLSSMDGYGDLVGEDYGVRLPLGFAAGLEEPYRTVVRYPRWAPVREVASGALWYLTFRALEAVVR